MSDPDPSFAADGRAESPSNSFRSSASIDTLRARHALSRRLRAFFDDREFLEVTTPLLASETVLDRHIDPFRLTAFRDSRRPGTGPTYYLQTSPESHMKRLLASGATSLYQVTQAFRATESGALHNPEFTIVEWYRVGDDMMAGIQLLGELMTELLDCPTPTIRSYRDVFLEYVGLDPFTAEDEQLRRVVNRVGAGDDWEDRDDLLNLALSNLIQSRLTGPSPTVVHGFPVSQAALARKNADDPLIADRFELFHRGIELANGYAELTDAAELRARQLDVARRREDSGMPVIEIPCRFLAAMEAGIPSCTGVALGFDRLVMIATGMENLASVMPFVWGSA